MAAGALPTFSTNCRSTPRLPPSPTSLCVRSFLLRHPRRLAGGLSLPPPLSRRYFLPLLRQSPIMQSSIAAEAPAFPIVITSKSTGEARASKSSPRAARSSGAFADWLRLTNIPVWARVAILGSAVVLAIPFYKKILGIEESVEKAVEKVAEVVETAAEVTEKVAAEIAEALPGNSEIKQVIEEIEHIAEEADTDARETEQVIHKVDEIKDEVERLVEDQEKNNKSEEEKHKVVETITEIKSHENATTTTAHEVVSDGVSQSNREGK